ncbi:hypothetical protein GCM10018781_66820 [Kitasatospora indigofera]|uniref:Uncharacterized protein n=1 Tax=Kitasatospora indigofera TaxID=67307 RepID=A0A919GD30_9ACTN|nr:hypothetical protein GCM10018781_66820 [Kitasatospora indigofera]
MYGSGRADGRCHAEEWARERRGRTGRGVPAASGEGAGEPVRGGGAPGARAGRRVDRPGGGVLQLARQGANGADGQSVRFAARSRTRRGMDRTLGPRPKGCQEVSIAAAGRRTGARARTSLPPPDRSPPWSEGLPPPRRRVLRDRKAL